MAKQKGIIRLEGTIGGISFLKTEDGYLAREKTSVSGDKIRTDPAYIRTRENMSEFGTAGKGVRLIRSAFQEQLQSAKDSKLTSRMQKIMMLVVKADSVSERGQRNISDGELGFLQGFEFNRNAELASCCFMPYTSAIDRFTGTCTVDIPSFIPKLRVVPPQGATHFKMIMACSELDFANGIFIKAAAETAVLKWDAIPTALIRLEGVLTAGSAMPFTIVLGIQFFQVVNHTLQFKQRGF